MDVLRLLFATTLATTLLHALQPSPGYAQHGATPHSPYADEAAHRIKALAPDEVEAYLQGKGMGLARAAELNHYPGPLHVLALADALDLTVEQRAAAQTLCQQVRHNAMRLGRRIVDHEQALDALFTEGDADVANVQRRTAEIAQLQGQLRAVHLQAHIQMRSILTPEQVQRYDHLRGYAGASSTDVAPLQQTPAPDDSVHVVQVVEQFHDALASGDRAAAAALLLPDAVVLEAGHLETRAEYLAHHYALDAAFLKALTRTAQMHSVDLTDQAAWAASTSRLQGIYNGEAVDLDSTELMVLRPTPRGWRIAAIHWSSQPRRN